MRDCFSPSFTPTTCLWTGYTTAGYSSLLAVHCLEEEERHREAKRCRERRGKPVVSKRWMSRLKKGSGMAFRGRTVGKNRGGKGNAWSKQEKRWERKEYKESIERHKGIVLTPVMWKCSLLPVSEAAGTRLYLEHTHKLAQLHPERTHTLTQ